MKILAIDDDPVAQRVLEAALKLLGHEVSLGGDGAESWDWLQTNPVRVVVSDWQMPQMDGLELCRRIRAQRDRNYVYFILLTHHSATDENHQAALEAGVDDFLTKPINLRELHMRLHVAERMLDYTKQVRELESFLPICGYCKKIRDDQNYWQQIESYLHAHTGAVFSHGCCPDCFQSKMVPMLQASGVSDGEIQAMAPVVHRVEKR
ncbi:MAG: response regulator [Opitutus sp.]|nr:response regulator [Opitutus sp.]